MLFQPFFSSLLGFMLKLNGYQHCIYYLSYLVRRLINDIIPKPFGTFKYLLRKTLFAIVIEAGPGFMLIKNNLKNAFYLILITSVDYQLLGFKQEGLYYQEAYLLFSFCTALFIFNLFAKALYQIFFLLFLYLQIIYYLNNNIAIFFFFDLIAAKEFQFTYCAVIDILGVPQNDDKSSYSIVFECLSIDINIVYIKARLL